MQSESNSHELSRRSFLLGATASATAAILAACGASPSSSGIGTDAQGSATAIIANANATANSIVGKSTPAATTEVAGMISTPTSVKGGGQITTAAAPQATTTSTLANPIILLPMDVRETVGSSPGFKTVAFTLGVENRGAQPAVAWIGDRSLQQASLTSEDGFTFMPEEVKSKYYSVDDAFDILQLIPPGFRVKGVYGLGQTGFNATPTEDYATVMKFRVGQQTSGYTLKVPALGTGKTRQPQGGFPSVPLPKTGSNSSFRFPTDRPDTDFLALGTSVSIVGRGSVTVVGITQGKSDNASDSRVPSHLVTLRFHNDSKGVGNTFRVTMNVFGKDGIIYGGLGLEEGFNRRGPMGETIAGVLVNSDEIGPGIEKTIDAGLACPVGALSGKLVLSGDVNAIYNL